MFVAGQSFARRCVLFKSSINSRSLSSAFRAHGHRLFNSSCVNRIDVSCSPRFEFRPNYSSRRTMSCESVPSAATAAGIRRVVNDIVVSATDTRTYRGLELENGLTVMLIHDEKATKAAAGLDVRVGGYQDPEGLPGLAHFCEHMLFLGTEKFPVENDYHQFIDGHGGSCNAMTTERSTRFYFDVSVEQLEPALDRFAQFFIAPLFNADMTEREVNAVDSEFEQYLHNDGWRIGHVFSETCNPAHPHSKFYCGNKTTLWTSPLEREVNVRDALLAYHGKYYSSNIMALVVFGKESLDELTQLVVDRFSSIRNLDVSVPVPSAAPFRPEDLGIEVHVVPIKDQRSLTLQFPMRDFRKDYKSAPFHYVGHVIGHEAKGSLLSLLKKKGYSSSLEAGSSFTPGSFDMLEVTVDLTESGLDHVDEVIDYIFQFIKLMRSTEPEEWIFRELSDIALMSFRFQNQSEPIHEVLDLSDRLQDYPIVDALSVNSNFQDYRPELVKELLSYLTPQNVRIEVVAKKFEGQTDRKEKWFGAEYSVRHIAEARLNEWSNIALHPELALPPPNDFIPKSFDLKPHGDNPPQLPVLVRNSPLCAVWFKPDTRFKLPKCCVGLQIVTPKIFESPLSYCYSILFARLFHDAMAEFTYMATRCEINFQFSGDPRAMQLFVTGYDDKLRSFLEKVFVELLTFEPTEERFSVFKEMIVRELQNYFAEAPYSHASDLVQNMMESRNFRVPQILPHAKETTFSGLKEFISGLFTNCQLNLMTVGNMTQEESIALGGWIEDKLVSLRHTQPLADGQMWSHRQHRLPAGCSYQHKAVNEVHNSACVEIYYQVGEQTVEDNVRLLLVNQLMEEKFFDALRTKRQLGYLVGCSVRRSSGVQGYRLSVQSEKNAEHVERCMEAFLAEFEEKLSCLSDEEFSVAVQGLVVRLSQFPKHIYGELAQYWNEIISNRYCFDIREQCVERATTISKNEVVDFFKAHLSPSSCQRRKCCVHVLPKDGVTLDNIGDVPDGPPFMSSVDDVADIATFKASLPLYNAMKPYIALPNPGDAL